jgi:aryl-alcohol dehydrogenase-like predicted oxidoreductase
MTVFKPERPLDPQSAYRSPSSVDQIVGLAIADRRDNWVVARKFGYPTSLGPNEQGQSRKWIVESIEASLKRLGTDYIDILYFYRTLLDAPPRAGRGDKRIQQTEWRPESLKMARTIADHAAKHGTTSIAFALAWVLKNRLVNSTIAGPRTEAQWDSYVEALKLQLGPDDEKLVDSLVARGHASTPGYTDPGYPIEGRRVT